MRDLTEVLNLQLRLPIRGTTYVVDPPPANIGAHLVNRLALGIAADAGLPINDEDRGQLIVDDEDMPDFGRQCLGPVYDQMLADGISHPELEFATTTAFYAWTLGLEFAEQYWESAGELGRPTEQRSGRPTATPTPPAEASTTPTPASASGTKTTPLGLPVKG
jgi:hypothetical protein